MAGNISVEINPAAGTKSQLYTQNGQIELVLPGSAKAEVEAEIRTWGNWKYMKDAYEIESGLYNHYFYNKECDPTNIIYSKETEKSIWEAVMHLPRLWALSILLYYREGKSIADISKIMKTKENTVKTYLFRARKRLKHTLAPVYQDSIDF